MRDFLEGTMTSSKPSELFRRSDINRLMIAVIQEQDTEKALRALNKLGIMITHLSSAGGFLGRRNATFLIGFISGQEEKIVDALKESCKRRVEYIATPMEGTSLHLPAPMPVRVGGATVFIFEIDGYVEY
jgi:uncharacterized protein YaaQ